ncbi:hypothetical protein BV25DRAFT_1951632 [Artomyces pyxidatus]|uniref:Uncharacterized protein n=1 Tax=Artomyces pyxidatus TaxID=48021 RepID=A0ACB8SEP3_9AGAM|nr:hypothetical protein BV25DRAFT_1951632 [Artomyces pyxidatus]
MNVTLGWKKATRKGMERSVTLAALLAVPGVENELDKWRHSSRTPGKYKDIFDGLICQELKGHDGLPFFANEPGSLSAGPNGELRIGLTLGVDWFSYHRSQISPSHASCPMSFNIVNLPPYLRYRTANLLLSGIMPGPKEQGPDETQRFMRVTVNELLRLWESGFRVPTPSCPEGRLKEKATPESFAEDGTILGFPQRTDEEHRCAGYWYTQCKSQNARDKFVKEYATRFTELSRLPYFDIVRMIVIDPMHNLILGVSLEQHAQIISPAQSQPLGLVKTHFYHIWVQGKILRKTKELNVLHQMLAEFEIPGYLGRLPTLVGIPAGGSLTADQWLLLATVVGPIAIPQIWAEFLTNPDEARAQRSASIASRLRTKKTKAKKGGNDTQAATETSSQLGDEPRPPDPTANTGPRQSKPKRKRARGKSPLRTGDAEAAASDDEDDSPGLHPDDPMNFIKLCSALKVLLAHELTDEDLKAADGLLRSYCFELITLYGPDVIKPNHHYAMHTVECIRDYGPLHGFWTFLFERLNKVLKSYKTNNHAGGELEVTFFREFHRTILSSRFVSPIVAKAGQTDQSVEMQAAVTAMFGATDDNRGTVQALARDLDGETRDDTILFALSPRYEKQTIDGPIYSSILRHLTMIFPGIPLRSHISSDLAPGTIPLQATGTFFDYTVIRGRRYHASQRATKPAGSLVEVDVDNSGRTWAGELLDIIQIDQTAFGLGIYTLGHF